MQIDALIAQIATISIALVFALSALHKLSDWRRFRDAVAGYRILPESLVIAVAPLVLLAEIAAVALLLTPTTRSSGALLATSILLAYAMAIGVNLKRGRTRIDCGCLGPRHRQRISSALVLRNAALALTALVASLPSNRRELETIDWLTMAGGIAMLALLYAIAEQLISTQRSTAATENGASA